MHDHTHTRYKGFLENMRNLRAPIESSIGARLYATHFVAQSCARMRTLRNH